MTSTEIGFSHMTCYMFVSLNYYALMLELGETYEAEIQTLDNEGSVSGSRSGNQDSLGTTVRHTILGVCIVFYRRRQIFCYPLVATGLCIASSDELDPRLLKCKNACSNGT